MDIEIIKQAVRDELEKEKPSLSKRIINYLGKYIFPFILGAATIITGVATLNSKLIGEEVEKQFRPFKNWELIDWRFDYNKQKTKERTDPKDLKIEDLSRLSILYKAYTEDMKNEELDEKAAEIERMKTNFDRGKQK